MQQVISQQTTATKPHSQATYLLPGHGTGTRSPASNDEHFLQEESVFKMTLSVSSVVETDSVSSCSSISSASSSVMTE